ncbi:hypothetical protein [Brazilian marseillevirus]|uniref:hypothetical protein n=1 Tax=Brazilian marseillevirus TaxID=1813599 RepID=UPI00078265CE|nr:hypothetical protein A3303_gp010 [Brazilian marseillevirus]AMQ10518.1 hypothetical protein [Brazilian marseillevirus]
MKGEIHKKKNGEFDYVSFSCKREGLELAIFCGLPTAKETLGLLSPFLLEMQRGGEAVCRFGDGTELDCKNGRVSFQIAHGITPKSVNILGVRLLDDECIPAFQKVCDELEKL